MEVRILPRESILAGGVIGNIPDSDSGESRFETWPASQFHTPS